MEKGIEKIIEKAKNDSRVLAVALFGSSLKGEGRDVDICIFLEKKLTNLEMSRVRLEFLKDLNDKFDLNVFQQLPLYIRKRILKEGKILFVKDEDNLYEIAFSTIREFEFYKKVYQMCLDRVKYG